MYTSYKDKLILHLSYHEQIRTLRSFLCLPVSIGENKYHEIWVSFHHILEVRMWNQNLSLYFQHTFTHLQIVLLGKTSDI